MWISLKAKLKTSTIVNKNVNLLSKIFNLMDLDSDGKITFNEFLISGQKLNCSFNVEKAKNLFKSLDINHDNKISFDEYVLYYAHKWEKVTPEKEKLFLEHCSSLDRILSNKDQTIPKLFPSEMWALLFSYLQGNDCVNLRSCCRRWNEIFRRWIPDKPILSKIELVTTTGTVSCVNHDWYGVNYSDYIVNKEIAIIKWKGFSPVIHKYFLPGYFKLATLTKTENLINILPQTFPMTKDSNEYHCELYPIPNAENICILAINCFGYVKSSPKTLKHSSGHK